MSLETDDGAAEAFRDQLRAKTTGSECVLDVSAANIQMFAQGSYKLIIDDLWNAKIGDEWVSKVDNVLRTHGVADAFTVRTELVNYKKVCLNVWRGAKSVERDLAQLCTFHFHDVKRLDNIESVQMGDYVQSDAYVAASCALSSCRGAIRGLTDARMFTKLICCLPRHPEGAPPAKLSRMPSTIMLFQYLDGFCKFIREQTDIAKEERDDPPGPYPVTEDVVVTTATERNPVTTAEATTAEISKDLLASGLPDYIVEYVRLSTIARGGDKALRIHHQLRYFVEILGILVDQYEVAVTALKMPRTFVHANDQIFNEIHTTRHMHHAITAQTALKDMHKWLLAISEVPASRLFVASECAIVAESSMFLPPDFLLPTTLTYARETIATYLPPMRVAAREEGWPSETKLRAQIKGDYPCRECNNSFSKLWAHRGICMLCEEKLRNAGRCPMRAKCKPESFCQHGRKCFVCDEWSCHRCRIWRGDGEDVQQIVEDLKPCAVFFDFDRTLCTTKAGASPLNKSHSCDPELLSICKNHPNVHIVTRNSHRDDIVEFLRRNGAMNAVHSVKTLGITKADKIKQLLEDYQKVSGDMDDRPCVFVDDNINEHLDPELRAIPNITQVLFTRG